MARKKNLPVRIAGSFKKLVVQLFHRKGGEGLQCEYGRILGPLRV